MEKLWRYELDYEIAYAYFFKKLARANELSKQLLSVDFRSGRFFTILKKNIEREFLYDFKYGDISIVPRIKTEELIFNIVNSNEQISVWFDDYNQRYFEGYEEAIFLKYGVHYNKEIYYQMNYETILFEFLKECFNYSHAYWHSLCMLTTTKISFSDKELSIEQIKDLSFNAQLILVSAYDDGDGFIFWERTNEFHPYISDILN